MDHNHYKNHSKGSGEKAITLKSRGQNVVQAQTPVKKLLLPSLTIRENNRRHTRFSSLNSAQVPESIHAVPRLNTSGIKPLTKPSEDPGKKSVDQLSDGSPETDFFKDSSLNVPTRQPGCASLSPRKEKKGPSRFLPISQMRPAVKKPQLYNAIKAFGKDFEKVLEKRTEKISNCRYFESPDSPALPQEAFSLEERLYDFDFLKISENYSKINNEKVEPRLSIF